MISKYESVEDDDEENVTLMSQETKESQTDETKRLSIPTPTSMIAHKREISSNIFAINSQSTFETDTLSSKDMTNLIHAHREYESKFKCKCCTHKVHRVIYWITKIKLILISLLLFMAGLIISLYTSPREDIQLNEEIKFYLIYLAILIACVIFTELLTYGIMKLLKYCVRNTWKVLYTKDISNRLFVAVLCILCFIAYHIYEDTDEHDYHFTLYNMVLCVYISSIVFLFTQIVVKYIALTSYFDIFRQRARKLKAYSTFLRIMLNLPNDDNHDVFSMPLMNFLIEYPTREQMKEAKKLRRHITFGTTEENINLTQSEKDQLSNLITTNFQKNYPFTLNCSLLTVELDADIKGVNHANSISEEGLNQLSILLAHLILIRLNKACKKKTGKNNKITKQCFVKLFEEYDTQNQELLTELGELAWKKFTDEKNHDLCPNVLAMNICEIIDELLHLKHSIDSYIVIINNLQRMVDIVTPVVLIFVYLYVFNLDFQETLTLYLSSIIVVSFFAKEYFQAVFASASFIIALNPFLVGDKLWFDNDFYEVKRISLISCVFTNLRTGWDHTFQNKVLDAASAPIINLSRSDKMRYRWIVYFKSGVDNKFLYDFTQKCIEAIGVIRDEELRIIENDCYVDRTKKRDPKRSSYCTYLELKAMDVESIVFKAIKLDEYGRKQVMIEMRYNDYSWNVRTLCFNCITSVADKDEFKEYVCDNLPVKMDGIEQFVSSEYS